MRHREKPQGTASSWDTSHETLQVTVGSQIPWPNLTTHGRSVADRPRIRDAYRLYTARWSLADLTSDRRRPPTTAPTGSHRPTRAHPPRPGLRAWGRGSGRYPACRCSTNGPSSPELWSARSRAPPSPHAAGRTTSSRTSRRRCSSSCSRPSRPTPEHDDQEQEPGRQEAVDLTALRALRESRTDVEALDLTAERLRRLGDAFTTAADGARATMDRYAHRVPS